MFKMKSYDTRVSKSMKTVVRLDRVFNRINNITENHLSKNNLTFNQFKVLEVLYHLGDLNTGSITKLTSSTPGNTTVVVRNLKRDGFIESKKDLNDARASILSITKSGEEIIEEVFPKHAENLYDFMNILDDKELDTLYDLLDKLYKTNKKD
ncbi:MarR family winged helix-turn-helix transcriptional regulator [Aliarcobacter thereius]|uniref:HTH-type transcriptional regulator MhqR n=2 Tax=Aliarcobacter thereius TaxID=544718 RepID=A0A1C0B9V8_9BACT|nr:MarR family transcriptional regulator [Aliarcobacter thereius]OCL91981.1 HTH-type transcriptional regulator MhqR [Aliarcobacter thereius]OCL94921.1 HTH-type transcriptional regulator MhqR [Aliarcobacter thereius LMG 24486]OCM00369.1 HTH-type transcriptional regulator MhqR [Aliarcobacter thereius]QBF15207.1 transcriptional regulator, MarR family [Aliarcobacter thereius LMG 24486]TLS72574.1 MarR family transcriptional regulator [Aliarcobacter thereius]